MKLIELAEQTNAVLERGDPNVEIIRAAGLDEAQHGDITFLSNPKYTPRARDTGASAIYLNENAEIDNDAIAVLRAKDSYLAFTRALRLFHPEQRPQSGVHPTAAIDRSAQLGNNIFIGAHVSIAANCVIGNNVCIHPNVTIYENTSIGDDTVIHSGVSIRENTIIGVRVRIYNNAVIGSDGFGYAKDERKSWLKIPQVGRCVIEDDVEIGAGTCIDKASTGESRIRRGAKIDNLVQIGHSCTVGEDALICAQTGLAGSSHIGARVILAGQVGIAGHLTVGDDAIMTAGSATSHDIAPGKLMSGKPAFDNKDWLRSTAAFRRLGGMARANREMEKRIVALETDSAK
ncbi:MAG: UDP-3-O-(3-hydroxymyristoyl)glucosamine N-acyltransferase [Pyrinomonadaceae bacterium MAG19_C2-C3]|nr:UDP-3-O-(3-hydroxymyristoyl)glucosamine N-acyltransferase [Pyrinomonadaceae bacterium MAG19_C2-C3]